MSTTSLLPERIACFPFPFTGDTYRYSTNVEPARQVRTTEAGTWGKRILDIDEEYESELDLRSCILRRDPSRCFVLPHMRPATWDAMMTLMRELAVTYPEHMSLREDGSDWVWTNTLLGIEQRFTFGEDDSLPCEPLRFLGNQVQEDMALLDQREDALWLDAGLVTFAADWSMKFNVGMRFLDVHGPVPRVHEEGIIPRAEKFLMRLQPEAPYRRTNWTMTVGRRLDTSTETYPEWGPDRRLVLHDDLGERLHLRVEVQHLIRLPGSGSVLFLVRTYLLSLAELAVVPEWRRRFAAVLAELPQDMVDYKGLTRYRDAAMHWLHEGDDT